jgi:hypothetical protein
MLALNSILGPFVLDAIDYGFSETVNNQGLGLDAVSLVVVAPLALFAAMLIARGNPAGPLLALAIGAYSAYMAVQYLVGPNYVVAAHIWPFHLACFVVAIVVAVGAWTKSAESPLEPVRGCGEAHHVLRAFSVDGGIRGMALPATRQALAGSPTR